jgi:hypothetical protein
MQNPTDQAETSIPTETTVINNVPNIDRTVTVRRKAATHTLSFEMAAGELKLVSPSPQAEDIPATRKKPRLDEPFLTTTTEADGKTASPDISVGLSSPAADNDANANVDLVPDTQPNAGATGHWTKEEDAKLNRAITNTPLKKWDKGYTRPIRMQLPRWFLIEHKASVRTDGIAS